MNTKSYLQKTAARNNALPLLSFPAVQKLNVTVRELLLSSELQARAIACVAENTDCAAAVSLMDLSVEAEAFGAEICFSENEVPFVSGRLVSDRDGVDALVVPTVGASRTGICVEAVKKAKALVTDRPVLAGVIGPFSLAGRLLGVTEIMYACFDDPAMTKSAVNKASRFIISYCEAFKDAGADGVVLAEPMAGLLNPSMAKEFSCLDVKRIIDAVQTDCFSVVYHNCGKSASAALPELFEMGAAAYHFGNSVDMADILSKSPADVLCLGNIDPASLFANGTPDMMRAETLSLLDRCAKYPNFLLSSGCDIPASVSWDNINAFFDALAEWKRDNPYAGK